MLLKPYPDRALPALARVVSDVLTLAWMVAWALAGLAVYQTVMALEAIADGITSTGRTFNSWIEAIRSITPRGVPYLSNFLLDEANALQRASGDQLVALGNQVHGDIFQAAVILGLMVAVPPIVIVAVAYGSWRYRDMREMGAAMQFVRIAYLTGRAEQARAVLAYRAISSLSFRQLMRASSDPVGDRDQQRHAGQEPDREIRRLGPPQEQQVPVTARRLRGGFGGGRAGERGHAALRWFRLAPGVAVGPEEDPMIAGPEGGHVEGRVVFVGDRERGDLGQRRLQRREVGAAVSRVPEAAAVRRPAITGDVEAVEAVADERQLVEVGRGKGPTSTERPAPGPAVVDRHVEARVRPHQ